MSSTAAAAAPGLAGAWFGELAAALQGRWQHAVAPISGEQPKRLGAGASLALAERSKKAAGGAAGTRKTAAKKEEEEDVGVCGATMSDATLYLLLDRFTPN